MGCRFSEARRTNLQFPFPENPFAEGPLLSGLASSPFARPRAATHRRAPFKLGTSDCCDDFQARKIRALCRDASGRIPLMFWPLSMCIFDDQCIAKLAPAGDIVNNQHKACHVPCMLLVFLHKSHQLYPDASCNELHHPLSAQII